MAPRFVEEIPECAADLDELSAGHVLAQRGHDIAELVPKLAFTPGVIGVAIAMPTLVVGLRVDSRRIEARWQFRACQTTRALDDVEAVHHETRAGLPTATCDADHAA